MKKVFALAAKDLRVLVRDKVGFFFAFVFPILYASLFGAIMASMSRGPGGRGGMEIAVVDQDGTEASAAFVATLDESPEFDVLRSDRAQAADLVRRGKRVAYIILPPGFGQARSQPFWGEPPAIVIGVDPARQAEAGMLEGLLTAMLFEGMKDAFTDPEVMSRQVDEALAAIQSAEAAQDMDPVTRAALSTFLPALRGLVQSMPAGETTSGVFKPASIQVTDVARTHKGPPWGRSYNISFPQGIVWGIMGCAAGFGISLVVERTRGTLIRLRMSPINRAQILAGKGLACLVTTLTVATMLFAFGWLVFGVRPDSYAKLALAIVSVALGFVGIMMLLSVLGKTEQSAGGIGWAILMVMAMIGGGMIPLFFLPDWLQTIGSISPIKWSILALEGAIWRGFSLGEMLKPCGILLGIGVVCFAAGARAFRWTERG